MKIFRFLKIIDSCITGVKEIYYHKMRSLLTVICMMLGVASLIAVMGILNGFKQSFIQFSNSQGGSSRVSIYNLNPQEKENLSKKFKVTGITINDMKILLDAHKDIFSFIIPQVTTGNFIILRGNRSLNTWSFNVLGSTSEYINVDNYQIDEGRNIVPLDDASLSRVCVIGSVVKSELFSEYESPLGESLNINGINFKVVGTFKHQSSEPLNILGTPKDGEEQEKKIAESMKKRRIKMPKRAIVTSKINIQNLQGWQIWEKYGKGNAIWYKNIKVLIPFSTFQLLFKENDVLDSYEMRLKNSESLTAKMEEIKKTMIKAHNGAEDFRIKPWSENFEQFNKQIRLFSTVFMFISIIALFVGGIGTTNVILSSISERIREIGVRKSVGARNRDIFIQFLIETVILSILGGILGIGAGMGLAALFSTFAGIRTVVSWYFIFVAVGVSFVVGILSGLYPSFKASRLNPIDALRYE